MQFKVKDVKRSPIRSEGTITKVGCQHKGHVEEAEIDIVDEEVDTRRVRLVFYIIVKTAARCATTRTY